MVWNSKNRPFPDIAWTPPSSARDATGPDAAGVGPPVRGRGHKRVERGAGWKRAQAVGGIAQERDQLAVRGHRRREADCPSELGPVRSDAHSLGRLRQPVVARRRRCASWCPRPGARADLVVAGEGHEPSVRRDPREVGWRTHRRRFAAVVPDAHPLGRAELRSRTKMSHAPFVSPPGPRACSPGCRTRRSGRPPRSRRRTNRRRSGRRRSRRSRARSRAAADRARRCRGQSLVSTPGPSRFVAVAAEGDVAAVGRDDGARRPEHAGEAVCLDAPRSRRSRARSSAERAVVDVDVWTAVRVVPADEVGSRRWRRRRSARRPRRAAWRERPLPCGAVGDPLRAAAAPSSSASERPHEDESVRDGERLRRRSTGAASTARIGLQ